MTKIKQLLYENHYFKSLANSAYVYCIFLFHLIVNLLPGVLRSQIFRLVLCRCGKRVFFDHNIYIKFPWLVKIGDSVVLNRGVEIYCDFFGQAKVCIGSGVRIAPNVRIHASGHETESGMFLHKGEEIVIEDNVWIGAAAIILPGVRIGEGSVVGAGSVVNKDVPPYKVVAGVPAAVIKSLPRPDGDSDG